MGAGLAPRKAPDGVSEPAAAQPVRGAEGVVAAGRDNAGCWRLRWREAGVGAVTVAPAAEAEPRGAARRRESAAGLRTTHTSPCPGVGARRCGHLLWRGAGMLALLALMGLWRVGFRFGGLGLLSGIFF